MKKIIATLFASAAFLAPLAYSDETVTVDVAVPVDATLLASEDGVKTLLNTVKVEARRACAFDTSISHIPMVDKTCVAQIVTQAETQLAQPDFATANADMVLRASYAS